MEQPKSPKVVKIHLCKKCNYKCSRMYDYKKHLLTAKHNAEQMEQQKSSNVVKVVKQFTCDCGKSYKVSSGLWKHRKICTHIVKSMVIQEKPEEKPSMMEIISQNKEIIDMLVLQNKEQADIIRELIPKIGNNNNTVTTTTNNQFNLQTFLNEDCKEALNFSDFIETIKISFEDLENQAESGYIKGITKLFIENLQGLGTNNRPIHCTDKKRKTLYIKENDTWDKEGSQDTLKKGIQEVTKRTMQTLMKEKENNSEEYSDMDSDFSMKCIDIQRNLIPHAPRETTISKIVCNITDNTIIVDNTKTTVE